jgi:dephospho-CoA kinase
MPNKRDYLLVGVTGGIGSGKSIVCSCFERIGRTVLKADAIAQEISDSDPAVREQIVRLLGPEAYAPNGPLNRPFVAGKVFSDFALLRKLNAVLHPPTIQKIEKTAGELPVSRRRPYVIVEAALIFESGMDEMLDKVIVVDASESIRIERVMARDGIDRDAVLRRMAAQLPPEVKVKHGDFVIRNEENRISLEDKVRFIDALLCSMTPGRQ